MTNDDQYLQHLQHNFQLFSRDWLQPFCWMCGPHASVRFSRHGRASCTGGGRLFGFSTKHRLISQDDCTFISRRICSIFISSSQFLSHTDSLYLYNSLTVAMDRVMVYFNVSCSRKLSEKMTSTEHSYFKLIPERTFQSMQKMAVLCSLLLL